MEVPKEADSSENLHDKSRPGKLLIDLTRDCLVSAVQYSNHTQRDDGHWCGELRANATISAEYVFLYQALELDLTNSRDPLCQWLLSQQQVDGSWSIAPDYPGDVSTTVEVYLALKILNISTNDPAMGRARAFILGAGGVSKIRVFTRVYLALFGLFSWDDVPELPAELIFMPSWSPINIYKFSSWARSTIVPLLILHHHRPVFPLPNGTSASNDYLDELWCGPKKNVPYAKSLYALSQTDGIALMFAVIDKILSYLNGLRSFFPRNRARRLCVEWILEHQDKSGDWAGIFPPMHFGLLALVLEGHKIEDDCVQRGLSAIERFAWQDGGGKRIQSCVSPVWDSVLMSIGISDSGELGRNSNSNRALEWVQNRQLLGPEGDWRIYCPQTRPGGFSFEYYNAWYPDVDDTAAVILAFLKQDPSSAGSSCILDAVEWVLGMQNRDGGWAAFDINNDAVFLNKIPFSDMNSLSDPSSADVTGRVLEAFGLFISTVAQHDENTKPTTTAARAHDLTVRINSSLAPAFAYLANTQEPDTGAWYGRWGSNYIYGTSNVLCGLSQLHHLSQLQLHLPSSKPFPTLFSADRHLQYLADTALNWLKKVQNPDGGFGETLFSYTDPALAGRGASTASQTAWGVMGLLAFLPSGDEAVERGVEWLVRRQVREEGGNGAEGDAGSTWQEKEYTGTGFPGFFYIGYDLYRHYFPMMALGRYHSKAVKEREGR